MIYLTVKIHSKVPLLGEYYKDESYLDKDLMYFRTILSHFDSIDEIPGQYLVNEDGEYLYDEIESNLETFGFHMTSKHESPDGTETSYHLVNDETIDVKTDGQDGKILESMKKEYHTKIRNRKINKIT